ncbi:Nif3-like dinuclear metal center hexameric protein [Mycoplasmatota bacterium WC44]
MKLIKIIDLITEDFPLELQHENDNSGLQVGSVHKIIKRVLITLDITKDVIDEAIINEVDLILSHHPLNFNPLRNVNYDEYYGYLISKVIENNISVFSMHTNYDKAEKGMNYQLVKNLGANDIMQSGYNDFLFTGKIKESDLTEFVDLIKNTYKRENIRYCGNSDVAISRIGIIGGSGGDYSDVDSAIKEGVDIFLTCDTKSSRMRYAVENGLNVLDLSHNIEEIFVDHMEKIISKTGIEVLKSNIQTDPYIFL